MIFESDVCLERACSVLPRTMVFVVIAAGIYDLQLCGVTQATRGGPLASAIGLCAPTAGSCVVGAPVSGEHRRHAHELSGGGRVYLQPVADVDTDMTYPGLVRVG